MTRYQHLSQKEHIISMTTPEVKYLRGLLRRGPLTRKKRDEDVHDALLQACRSFLDPRPPRQH